MSRRSELKRREEEARRKQEMMRRQMLMQQRAYMQQQMAYSGYNNNNANANLSYGPMSNTNVTPCAMPSRFIQLTPIIQPIAMVPYSTQNQPLMMYNDQNGFGPEYGSMNNYGGIPGGSLGALNNAFDSYDPGGDDDYF